MTEFPRVPSSEVELTDEFYRALLKLVSGTILVVDSGGSIVFMNRGAEKLFGFSLADMRRQSVALLIPKWFDDQESDKQEADGSRGDSTASCKPFGLDVVGRHRDGEEFLVNSICNRFVAGGFEYLACMISGTSSRDTTDSTPDNARSEAERAKAANSIFLAAASHDLRQPVQALALLSGALRRTITEKKVLEVLDAQDRSIAALGKLLDSLVDLGKY